MRVKARYFAVIRDTLMKAEDNFEIETGTVADVLRLVSEANPQISGLIEDMLAKKSCIVAAYNCEYVLDYGLPVADRSELALIPPGSGG
mmetsp:Transcript_6489/g.11356  ORF Transcript_6489/g.11356 Transcript_6489/m.11356 type:complete len:89 (-) Transcript_6489:761-1027(-)